MAGITLAKAKTVFRRELDCSPEDEFLLDAIQEAIEFLLYHGGGEILREWKVLANEGKFTLPRDLGTPVKYKFARLPHLGSGTFHSPYYSYSSNSIRRWKGYLDWNEDIEGRARHIPVQFRPPRCGVRIAATTRNECDVGKHLIVGGKFRGKEVAGLHNGKKTAGELIKIYHEDDPNGRAGVYPFDEITSVVKDETLDWVKLSGYGIEDDTWYHLSYYHPDEEVPAYKEVEMFSHSYFTPYRQCCDVCMLILGRINPNLRYVRDGDILPISSLSMLQLLAKRARYDQTADLQEVAAYESRIKLQIRKEVAYQQEPNRRLDFALGGANGDTLANI
jgi:hypothetical protein